jgi:hypothetical protein
MKQLIFILGLAATAAAVLDQLRRPPEERTWYGMVFGVVPYDFRPPTMERVRQAWWNPDDPRLFTPREFGVGWAVNLYRIKELAMAQAYQDGDDGA